MSVLFVACGSGGTSQTNSDSQSQTGGNGTSTKSGGSSSDSSSSGEGTNGEQNTTTSQDDKNQSNTDDTPDTTLQPYSHLPQKVLNHMGQEVTKSFNGYTLKVVSNKTLQGIEETSQSTVGVYGKVNGQQTNALLKMNEHYQNSEIAIEVYYGSKLVGLSEVIEVQESDIAVNFHNIETKE
jgi:hypothetical protein